MLLAPGRFFKPESGTETLLMGTIGIRDFVLGGSRAARTQRRRRRDFRGWERGRRFRVSDTADLLLGLRSRPLWVPRAR